MFITQTFSELKRQGMYLVEF